jgi:hypothetical protein
MRKAVVVIAILLVLFSIIGTLIVPSITNCQVTNYYSTTRDYNQVAFTLTTNLPTDKATYSKNLPIQFNLIWNMSLESLLADHQPVKGYAYTIDDHQLVNVTPNGSLAVPRKESYWFSYSVDISNLAQGKHKISLIAYQYYNNFGYDYQGLFNQTSTPITFLVDNTLPLTSPTLTPTPTPSVPELSWLAILPLFASVLIVAILFRRHRKTANPPPKGKGNE